MQILLIEDSRIFRQSMRAVLEQRIPDADIREAGSAEQAEEFLTGRQPDVIFLDIRLPGESGLHLAARIRSRCQRARLIFLSDQDFPEYRAKAFQQGADHFLSKTALSMSDLDRVLAGISPAA